MINKILAFVFRLIRPFFVEDLDPNEDFVCGNCSKPVLRRVLFCSTRCSDRFDYKEKIQNGIDQLRDAKIFIKTESGQKIVGLVKSDSEDQITKYDADKITTNGLYYEYTLDFSPSTVQSIKTYLFYSPQLNLIIEDTRESGYIFKNKHGEFHLRYYTDTTRHSYKVYEFYIIGEV